RDASSRATKAFYPALSMCDLIFSGVFERHRRLTLAIVEFELSWAPNVLTSMDYTYRERHGEAIYRFKDGMLPSDFFRQNVVLSFQEDAIGIRLRDVIGVDNMMWGSDDPHSESTFPQSRKILAEILAGVPDDEQAKIAGGNTARLYRFDVARLTIPCRDGDPRIDFLVPVIDNAGLHQIGNSVADRAGMDAKAPFAAERVRHRLRERRGPARSSPGQ